MLRVTLIDNEAERTLMVEGNLIATCVAELESAWKEARVAARGRIVVDLTGTTFIDSSGQAALMAMIADGARLTAKGVYNEHLAQELTRRTREAGAFRTRQGRDLAMDSSLAKIAGHSARRSQNKGQRAR
jgi:ABC-type transporter Mla MlaB component